MIGIGGGQIGGKITVGKRLVKASPETTKIDKEIIKLSGKKKPKLLFIPTASSDSENYYNNIKAHFGKNLGCKLDVLYLIKEKPSKNEIKLKILKSDIIYVGGGNTFKMMKIWRKYNVDKILIKAYNKGIVLSGLSAGCLCWFRYGQSDSLTFPGAKKKRYVRLNMIGLINALHIPHYDTEKNIRNSLKKMMRRTPGVAIALDECCAIEIVDDTYRIISSKKGRNAYKTYWKKGKYYHEKIKQKKEFQPIKELLKK